MDWRTDSTLSLKKVAKSSAVSTPVSSLSTLPRKPSSVRHRRLLRLGAPVVVVLVFVQRSHHLQFLGPIALVGDSALPSEPSLCGPRAPSSCATVGVESPRRHRLDFATHLHHRAVLVEQLRRDITVELREIVGGRRIAKRHHFCLGYCNANFSS